MVEVPKIQACSSYGTQKGNSQGPETVKMAIMITIKTN